MSEQDSRPRRRGVTRAAAPSTSRTRAVAYVRVSTEKQADKGISLEAQQGKLKLYAELQELELLETIVDAGVSAKTLERPGLQRALGMLKAGKADALVVVKLDRLTRSVRDLGELVERHFGPGGPALLSVSEQIDTRSAGGRLVLNVLASVSQWEREAVGERTSAALQHKADQGEFCGGEAPYGFRAVPHPTELNAKGDGPLMVLEEDAAEQAVIQAAKELRSRALSLRKVADQLAARGFRSRAGEPFAAAQVARMVGSGSILVRTDAESVGPQS